MRLSKNGKLTIGAPGCSKRTLRATAGYVPPETMREIPKRKIKGKSRYARARRGESGAH